METIRLIPQSTSWPFVMHCHNIKIGVMYCLVSEHLLHGTFHNALWDTLCLTFSRYILVNSLQSRLFSEWFRTQLIRQLYSRHHSDKEWSGLHGGCCFFVSTVRLRVRRARRQGGSGKRHIWCGVRGPRPQQPGSTGHQRNTRERQQVRVWTGSSLHVLFVTLKVVHCRYHRIIIVKWT